MTTDTARHLNALRDTARPIVRVTGDDIPPAASAYAESGAAIYHCGGLEWAQVAHLLNPILHRHDAAAQAAEIREAAAERREARTRYCGCGHACGSDYAHGPWGGCAAHVWALAEGEVEAAIAADNARRLAEYEAYRLACEQGVAVPPQQG